MRRYNGRGEPGLGAQKDLRDSVTDPEAPMFSVVLLVRGEDRARLDAAVRSVRAPAGNDIEIILVDAGGTDQLRETIKKAVSSSRGPVQVVDAVGLGTPLALNAGSRLASGRYVSFLDSGDEYDSDRLDAFRRAHILCGGFDWGFSGVEAVSARDQPVPVEMIRDAALRTAILASTRSVEAIRHLARIFTPVTFGNLVVDAEVLRGLGGFRDSGRLFDWELSLRLFRAVDPVVIERPLYRHRLRQGRAKTGDYAAQARRDDKEGTAIIEEYWRGLFQDGFADGPSAPDREDPEQRLDRDSRIAISVALWGVDQLRRVPLLYRTARRVARLTR